MEAIQVWPSSLKVLRPDANQNVNLDANQDVRLKLDHKQPVSNKEDRRSNEDNALTNLANDLKRSLFT